MKLMKPRHVQPGASTWRLQPTALALEKKRGQVCPKRIFKNAPLLYQLLMALQAMKIADSEVE
jgi:hypothetical protein